MSYSTSSIGPAQDPLSDHVAEVNGLMDMPEISFPLTVLIDGSQQAIAPGTLMEEASAAAIADTCRDATSPPVFSLHHLLDWTDEERWAVFKLLALLHPYCLARSSVDENGQSSVLAVVLSLMVGVADITRCERGRRGAIEVAALFHVDALEPACTQIAQRLKALGVKGVLPQKLLKEARAVAGGVDQSKRDPKGAAEAFVASLRGETFPAQEDMPLRYFRDEFYVWECSREPWLGGRWSRLADAELKARVTRFLQGEEQVHEVTERFVRDVVVNLKGLTLLDAWNEQMPFYIAGAPANTPPTITHPRLLVFRNKMIDLDEAVDCLLTGADATPTLYDIPPRFFNLSTLPYCYDPEAECPLWEETLDGILPRKEPGDRRREVLQEFMAWTLFPGDMSYQKFLILVGSGRNGKSTVMDVWTSVLGRDNVSHVPLNHLDGEFRLHEMASKLANIAGDMTRLDKVEEGVLKQLTTGDPIQVNRKHKAPVTLRPTARLIFGTNVLPPFSDRTDGVWRRMIAIPFLEQIPKNQVDPQRVTKLRNELPGILNWILAGAARLLRQQRFSACTVCERCAEDHRHDSDPFRQFLDQRVCFGDGATIVAEQLFGAYVEFCEANKRYPRASSEFGKQVLELPGVTKHRQGGGSRKWMYAGITLWQGM